MSGWLEMEWLEKELEPGEGAFFFGFLEGMRFSAPALPPALPPALRLLRLFSGHCLLFVLECSELPHLHTFRP
jgi:hypothetical protein